MNGSWHVLRMQSLRRTQTLRFFDRYRALRTRCPALEPFEQIQSLLEYLRGQSGTAKAKNRVLHALLEARQHDAEVAVTLLTLAVWPGLDSMFRRLCRGFPGDTQLVTDELISAFGENVVKANPEKIKVVAATLVRNANRDATRALTRQKRFAANLDPDIESRLAGLGNPVDDTPVSVCEDDGSKLRQRLERDFGKDAGLIYDVVVNDETLRSAASTRGIAYDAAKKRCQRITERIRRNRPDYLAPRVPMRSPGWHLSDDDTGSSGVTEDDANAGVRGKPRAASGDVSPMGTARNSADRRRIPARGRCGND